MYAMGRVFEYDDDDERKDTIEDPLDTEEQECKNKDCNTILTQEEIDENDGECYVCSIIRDQERQDELKHPDNKGA